MIAALRLQSQQINGTEFKSVKELAGWMGAIQAQDFAMAKWAIGVRLPGVTNQIVEQAIAKGEIIRTHVLRPTWHFVSAENIHWMLELTGKVIKAGMKGRLKELELTEEIVKKSNKIFEKALSGGKHLTREELMPMLNKAGIATDNNRSSHLLVSAELDGLICSGATSNGKQTYALLEERIQKPTPLSRDEALVKLALIYFSSHGPATLKDFSWWSGLSITAARPALEMIKTELVSKTIRNETYWFDASLAEVKGKKNTVYLLPAYDEFTISYKDRTASHPLIENQKRAASNNGIFWPLIVINGQVTGLWKRMIKNDQVIIETDFFKSHSKANKKLIEKAADSYGHFLGKTAIVQF